MKTSASLFLAVFCTLSLTAYCQKTEFRFNAYSGLFFFRGSGTSSTASVSYRNPFFYGNGKPFGRRTSYAYALELQVNRSTRKNFLYGFGISGEKSESKTLIDSTWDPERPNQVMHRSTNPKKNKITMGTAFLVFTPYIGQRIVAGKFNIDLQAGADLAVCTKLKETLQYYSPTESGYIPAIPAYRKRPFLDVRPRAQINAYYHRVGVTAGYSIGLTNFQSPETGYANSTAFTNFLRLGLSYRMK